MVVPIGVTRSIIMRRPDKKVLQLGRAGRSLRIVVATVLLLCLRDCRHPQPERAAAPPRDANVLFITVDTTRADHLSCYGAHGARTPHLDALAARGARFEYAISQVPLTLPSTPASSRGPIPWFTSCGIWAGSARPVPPDACQHGPPRRLHHRGVRRLEGRGASMGFAAGFRHLRR